MQRMTITVRQATGADIAEVSGILLEAAQWLVQRGEPMWKADELHAERVSDDIQNGLFFLAECEAHPIATMKFQLSDPDFWPDVPADESAFIHRLAVRRSHAGGAVSSALLSWARRRAESLGRRYLRLDCEASRLRLRSLYEGAGFQHHSDRQVGPYFVARYQIELS
jgi:GNAT superfamily N-acetyltransferase